MATECSIKRLGELEAKLRKRDKRAVEKSTSNSGFYQSGRVVSERDVGNCSIISRLWPTISHILLSTTIVMKRTEAGAEGKRYQCAPLYFVQLSCGAPYLQLSKTM